MTPTIFAQAILSIEQNYGLRLDARSVWLRMDEFKEVKELKGGKCNEATGWYGLKGACKRGKKGEGDARTKESKVDIANRIRTNKIAARDRDQTKQSRQSAKTGRIVDMPLNSITVDKKRFGLGGETNKKTLPSFNPNYAGAIQTWKDPKDGKTYVVDGIKRLESAQKSRESHISTMPIHANSAKEANDIGTFSNLASGSVSGLASGHLFRNSKIDENRLKKEGIDTEHPNVRQGLDLAKLDESAYDRVLTGDLTPKSGEMLGSSGLSHEAQRKIVKAMFPTKKDMFYSRGVAGLTNDHQRDSYMHEAIREEFYESTGDVPAKWERTYK